MNRTRRWWLLLVVPAIGVCALSAETCGQDTRPTWMRPDPAYMADNAPGPLMPSEAASGQLVSVNNVYEKLDARLSALEAANVGGDARDLHRHGLQETDGEILIVGGQDKL